MINELNDKEERELRDTLNFNTRDIKEFNNALQIRNLVLSRIDDSEDLQDLITSPVDAIRIAITILNEFKLLKNIGESQSFFKNEMKLK